MLCVGKKLAISELIVVVMLLVLRCKIQYAPGEDGLSVV